MSPPVPTKPTFAKIAFPRFDPVAIANVLLHPKEVSPELLEVLFAGFCAWVVFPTSKYHRKCAMIHAARKIYDDACDRLLEKRLPDQIDIPGRWKKSQIRRFKSQIYDKLGGHKAMYNVGPPTDWATEVEGLTDDSEMVVKLAEVWHHLVADEYVPGKKKLTIIDGADMAGKLGFTADDGKIRKRSGREVQTAFEYLGQSIAFRYAAAKISIPNVGTVLDQLLESKLTLSHAEPIFNRWFGRAAHYDRSVLCHLAHASSKPSKRPPLFKKQIQEDRLANLSTLNVVPDLIPAPSFVGRSNLFDGYYNKPRGKRPNK